MEKFHIPIKHETKRKNSLTNKDKSYLSAEKLIEKKSDFYSTKKLQIFEDKKENNTQKDLDKNKMPEVKEEKIVPKKKKPLKFSQKNKMLFREFLKNTLIKKGDKELLLIKCLKKDPQTRTKEDNNTIKNFLRNSKLVPALLEIPFFEQKNCDKFLNLISSEVKHRVVNQDETLFKMGTKADSLYIIYNGSVAIESLENYTVCLTCKQYLRAMVDKYQNLYDYKDNYMVMNKKDYIPFKKIINEEEMKDDDKEFSKFIFEKTLDKNKNIININKNEFYLLNLVLLVIEIKDILMSPRGNYNTLLFVIQSYNYDEKKILFHMDYLSNNFSPKNYQYNMNLIYKNIPEVNPELVNKYEKFVESEEKFNFTYFRKGKIFRLQRMGDCFGDVTPVLQFNNLNHIKEKRNYSVSIVESSNLAYIDYEKFIELLKIEKEEIKYAEAKFLKNSYFFSDINQYILSKKYLKYFTYEELQYTNYLFKEGDKNNYVYFLKFGKYEIFCNQTIKNLCSMIQEISQNYLNSPKKNEEYSKITNEILERIYFCNLVKKEFMDEIELKLLMLTDRCVIGMESTLNNLPYFYSVKILSEKCGYYKIDYNNLLLLMKEVKDGKEIINHIRNSHLELILDRMANVCQKKVNYIDNKSKLKKKKRRFFYRNDNQNGNEIKPKIIFNKIKEFLLDKSKRIKTSLTSRNEDHSFNKNRIKLYFLTELNKSKENRINLNNLNKSDNKNMKSINNIIYNRYLLNNNDSNKNYNFTINKFNKNIANLKETKSYFNKPYNTINVIRNNNLQEKYKKFSSQKAPKLNPSYNPIGIKYEENMIKTLKNTLENELLFFSSFSRNEISRNAKTAHTESKTEIRNINRNKEMNKISERKIDKSPDIDQNINKNKSTKNINDLNFEFNLEINTRKMSHLTRNRDHDNLLETNDSKVNLTFRKYTYTNKIGDNLFRNIIENEYKNKTSNNFYVKDNEDEKNVSNNSVNKNKNIKDICKGYLNFNVMLDNMNTKPKLESYSFRGKKYCPYNCYNKKLYKALKGRIGDNFFMNGQTPVPKIDY